MRARLLIPFALSLVLVASGCDSTSSTQAPTEEKSEDARLHEAKWAELVANYEAGTEDEARVLALFEAMTWWVKVKETSNGYTMRELDLTGWGNYIVEHANAELERIGPLVPAQVDPALIDDPKRPTILTRALHWAIFNVGYYENREARPPVEAMSAHLLAIIADDAPYDSRDIVPAFPIDAAYLFEVAYGREPTQQACTAALARLDPKTPHPRIMTMWVCQRAVGSEWRVDLAEWASKEDIAEFDKEWAGLLDAKIESEREANRAENDAALAKMEADLARERQEQEDWVENGSSDSSSSPSSDAGGGSTSVGYTIKNSCGASVKLAFANGDPKFKSSSTLGLSANQQTHNSSKPGQQIWIVDSSGSGIASTSVSASTKTVEITGSSCSSISAR